MRGPGVGPHALALLIVLAQRSHRSGIPERGGALKERVGLGEVPGGLRGEAFAIGLFALRVRLRGDDERACQGAHQEKRGETWEAG